MATETISVELSKQEFAGLAFLVGCVTPIVKAIPDDVILPLSLLVAKLQYTMPPDWHGIPLNELARY